MVSQKVISPVIARSETTKQSADFKLLQQMRLLRYTRNGGLLEFLRDCHTQQTKRCVAMWFGFG
jgi:hypothetical protein